MGCPNSFPSLEFLFTVRTYVCEVSKRSRFQEKKIRQKFAETRLIRCAISPTFSPSRFFFEKEMDV